MRKFAHAAILAVAISAPVLAGGLMDHPVVSVLGAPGSGGCSSGCGGAGNGGVNSNGKAQGGHTTFTNQFGSVTESGTVAVHGPLGPSSGQNTGRTAVGGSNPGTISGNATAGTPVKGHCTGQFLVGGVCG
jgi:hypothetical protein